MSDKAGVTDWQKAMFVWHPGEIEVVDPTPEERALLLARATEGGRG